MPKSTKIPLPPDHFYHDLMNALLERLDYIRIQPANIINFGVYTDHAGQQLQQCYPNAHIVNISNLNEIQKMADESIDFIFGHFPLLFNDPLLILREFSRVLRDEGLLLFTGLGLDTLYELRHSFSKVDIFSHTHDFVDMHHIGDWLKALAFDDPVVDRQILTLAYTDLALLFQDLKKLRITKLSVNPFRGLYTKNRWQKMLSQYHTFKIEDYYPVTIELIFAHGWKVKRNQTDEFVIRVDQIRKK